MNTSDNNNTSSNVLAAGLTENEIVAMKQCLNSSSREGQLGDNYSNGGTQEFMDALKNTKGEGWNAQQVGGLMSSLEQKGMGFADEEGVNGAAVDIFWLTEKGVNAIFDVIDAEEDEEVVEEVKDDGLDEYRNGLVQNREQTAQDALEAIAAQREQLNTLEEAIRYSNAEELADNMVGSLDVLEASAVFSAYGAARTLVEFDRQRGAAQSLADSKRATRGA
jgi:hypothetical protein